MSSLRSVLDVHVREGTVAGVVALVDQGRGDVQVEAVGVRDVEGGGAMRRDSIFGLASITKPLTAAAVMMLVEDGRIGLHDPVANWLPELASPRVVRTPGGPVDDARPPARSPSC